MKDTYMYMVYGFGLMFCPEDSDFLPEGVVLLVSALCAVLCGQPDPYEPQHGAREDDPDQAPEDGVLSEQRLLETGGYIAFQIII